MNIGILTFHHVYNYGALLQAYALQKCLEELGHNPQIIDIRTFHRDPPGAPSSGRMVRYAWRMWRKLGFIGKSQKELMFDSFRKTYIRSSPRFESLREIPEHFYAHLNALIVGSDQVWDPRFGRRAGDVYFLRDAKEGVKRISYAACAGSTVSNLSSLANRSGDLARFDAVSVRDQFTRDVIAPLSDTSVSLVVDPTLLIEWGEIVGEREESCDEKYVFYYGFSPNGDIAIEQITDTYDLKVVAVGMEADGFKGDVEYVSDAGPVEWVSLIKGASIVVTKSFHGMMFSLAFDKPVIVVPSNVRAISRLEDAGKRFGISSSVISPENKDFDVSSVLENFNAAEVYKSVSEQVQRSKEFLRRALDS